MGYFICCKLLSFWWHTLPSSSGLTTEAVRLLTCWYTANILLHIAIMQKTKYGVNPQSTVCDIVIIVITVLDPFCLQKEVKLWSPPPFIWSICWVHRNKLLCKILISFEICGCRDEEILLQRQKYYSWDIVLYSTANRQTTGF